MPSGQTAKRGDIRTQAIVLRRTKYRETDRILNLLTPEGRRSVIARGVRKERSKLAGGIEMFCVSEVTIHYRHNQAEQGDALGILTSAKMKQFYAGILGDLERLELGSEIIREVGRLSEQIDSPELFSVLRQVFEVLGEKNSSTSLVKAWFRVNYLRLSGEELNLHYDVSGRPLSPEQTYIWDSLERAMRPQEGGEITANHIKLLRLISTAPLGLVAKVMGVEDLVSGVDGVGK